MNDGAVPDEFHRLLAQYWDDVLAMLDEDEAHRLISLVQDIEGTDPNETLVELEDLLIDSLPGDHPLVTYLADRLKFQAPTAEGHRLSLLDMHRWLRAQVIPGQAAPDRVMPDQADADPVTPDAGDTAT